MLTKPELKKLINHENPEVSDKAVSLLRLLNLVDLNRSQLEHLVKKKSK